MALTLMRLSRLGLPAARTSVVVRGRACSHEIRALLTAASAAANMGRTVGAAVHDTLASAPSVTPVAAVKLQRPRLAPPVFAMGPVRKFSAWASPVARCVPPPPPPPPATPVAPGELPSLPVDSLTNEPHEEFHHGSTRYTNANRAVIRALDTHVKKSELPHREPVDVGDKIARALVWVLRKVTGAFYRTKYIHYAVVFETVAAVPGMVAGMLQHLKCLRRMEHNTLIKKLLDEAENERMHLMSFMDLSRPSLPERLFVLVAQAGFFVTYGFFYAFFPRVAHRFVAYLEEEAVKSYTEMLDSIDSGRVANPPAPAIAKAYWNLPADATLRDMVLVVRADEMDHRDVNHGISDKMARPAA